MPDKQQATKIDTSKYGELASTSILTGKEFMSILNAKHPINDFGAGIQHGLFTHRLQWYLLAQELIDYPAKYQTASSLTNTLSIEQLGEFYAKLGDPACIQ